MQEAVIQDHGNFFKRHWKPVLLILAAASLLGLLIAIWAGGPIPQDPAYHLFADDRSLAGIPYALDVLSNIAFLLGGSIGIYTTLGRREQMRSRSLFYLVFFVGVVLIGFGSAFYHYAPTNATLLWDRLPIALAFMSILSAILAERVNLRLATVLFPWLVIAGLASVLYWHWQDDLRPYLLVQFGTIAILLLLLALFPRPRSGFLWIAIACYVLAKVFEYYDAPIFILTSEWVSGHTLKHLVGALAPLLVAMKIRADMPRLPPPA